MIKSLLSPPSHMDMAKKELATAKRELLISQTQLEYAQAMVECNEKRIARLEKYVKEQIKRGEDRPETWVSRYIVPERGTYKKETTK